MEIQDRSIVTQQTTAQKLNFFQVADVEESVFAEMLKKPEEGDVVQQSNNIEIKGAEGAKNRTPRVKVSEVRKEFPQKKIEKTEVKNQNEKDVKASLQEKKSDNSKVKNEKNDLEQPNEEKLSPETPKKEDSENETISGAMMLENTPVMEKVFNEEVLNNNGIEIADTDEAEALALVEPIVLGVSENNKEKVVLEQQSEIEDIYVKPTENSFEMIKMANSEAISGEPCLVKS